MSERSEAELQELTGRQVRSFFFERKRLQLNGPYRPAPRHDNHELWLRIGANCRAANAAPKDFVLAAFRYNLVPGGPFPTQLTGDCARRWHAERLHEIGWRPGDSRFSSPMVMELHQRLVGRMRSLLGMTRNGRRLFLRLASSDLDAWERVLLSNLDPLVLQQYGAEASRQLCANLALVEALEELKWSDQLQRLETWNNERRKSE